MKFENDDVINRINCFCHMLNNLIGCMCTVEPVKKIIDDASTLVSFIRNSGLNEYCNPKLQKYIEVRWNTVFYTLNSVALNYSKIAEILLEKERADKNADVMQKITIIPRNCLQIICEFLKKFKVWIDQLEADKKPTLWMVWPTFISLKKFLSDSNDDHDIIKQMKVVGRRYLEKNDNDFTPKLVHKISTVLHPLLKNIAIANETEKKDVYGFIDDFIWKTEPFHATVENDLSLLDPEHPNNQEILEAFMGTATFESEPDNNYTNEFQGYLQLKIPKSNPYDFNMCAWWHTNRHVFPKLCQLFVSKAGITSSSAPSERKFSETGIIITARRSNLLPETVSDLVLARNKLMDFL